MKKFEELRMAAKSYLRARKKFRRLTDKIPEINGNDNLIGRIGEFVALQFLRKELKKKIVVRNTNAVQAGYDIVADGKNISVKTITHENSTGRTTHILEPWDELVVVELIDEKVCRVGYLKKNGFENAFKDGFIKNRNPITSRNMLKENGLIGKYGKVYKASEIGAYL